MRGLFDYLYIQSEYHGMTNADALCSGGKLSKIHGNGAAWLYVNSRQILSYASALSRWERQRDNDDKNSSSTGSPLSMELFGWMAWSMYKCILWRLCYRQRNNRTKAYTQCPPHAGWCAHGTDNPERYRLIFWHIRSVINSIGYAMTVGVKWMWFNEITPE